MNLHGELSANDESVSVREIKRHPTSTSCRCFGREPIKRQHSAASEPMAALLLVFLRLMWLWTCLQAGVRSIKEKHSVICLHVERGIVQAFIYTRLLVLLFFSVFFLHIWINFLMTSAEFNQVFNEEERWSLQCCCPPGLESDTCGIELLNYVKELLNFITLF